MKARWGWSAAVIVAVLGAGLFLLYPRTQNSVPDADLFPELVAAGRWLAPYANPATAIYETQPHASRHAGGVHREFPPGDYEQVLDAIVAQGGDFVVLSQAAVPPALEPLVWDKGVAGNEPRLRAVYVDASASDRVALVYRVVRPGGPDPLPTERPVRRELSALHHQTAHFLHGMLAMRKEQWQTAAGEFAFAIIADSTRAVAYNNRAWCLLRANLAMEIAESCARQAVELEPQNTEFLSTLIDVLEHRGMDVAAASFQARLDSLAAGSAP